METIFVIKNNATTLYMKDENASSTVWKFIAENEWKKMFIHWLDENDQEMVRVSQYEKSAKILMPYELLEEKEIEENIESEIIEKEKNILDLIKINKWLIFWIIIWLVFWIWINANNIKANIIEKTQTWQITTPEIEPQDMIWVYTDRLIILEKKVDVELKKQANFRNEIKKSIENVKLIEKEKEIIQNKKIELAN